MTLEDIRKHNIRYFRTPSMAVGYCFTEGSQNKFQIRAWNIIFVNDVSLGEMETYMPCTKYGVDVDLDYDYNFDNTPKPNKNHFGQYSDGDERAWLEYALKGNSSFNYLIEKV